MKKFPRIHSLSTVNLIYHRDYDYDFHATRTDFSGDSGVGKSIIADLLQLILVGSNNFKTATLSDGERPPNTLVFGNPSNGVDMGYAFMNIEKSRNKFVVIGIYIQNNESHAKSFIIQRGHDCKENGAMIMLERPLSCQDFINQEDNGVLPIGVCKDQLFETKRFVLDEFGHERYFKILSDNNILPINVNADNYKSSIKIYTEIIRTFSRGSKINFGQDSELKRFLFGDEGKKKIWQQYDKIKNDLANDITQHKQTLEDIEGINKKLSDLTVLLDKKKNKENTNLEWLKANIGFCKFQYANSKELFEKKSSNWIIVFQKLKLFDTFIKEKQLFFANEQTTIKPLYDKTLLKLQPVKTQYEKIEKVKEWLSTYNTKNTEELVVIFQEQQTKRKIKTQLNDLEIKLAELKIVDNFKKSEWTKGYLHGFKWNNNEINSRDTQIKQNEILEKFSNLTNQDSLGYWAVNRSKPFTIEEESILMYFQKKDISTQMPAIFKESDRYLLNPAIFFANFDAEIKNENGFWLNLGGVYEFIEYVKERQLHENPLKIRDIMQNWNNSLKTEITKLKAEKTSLEKLLNDVSNLPVEQIDAYIEKGIVGNFIFDEEFQISEEEFKTYLDCFLNKQEIENEHINLNASFINIDKRKDDNNANLNQTNVLIALLGEKLKVEKGYEIIWKKGNVKQDILLNNENYGEISNEWKNYFDLIEIISLESYQTLFDNQQTNTENLKNAKEKIKGFNIDAEEIECYQNEPIELATKAQRALQSYNIAYENIVNNKVFSFSEPEKVRMLDGNFDFVVLGVELLPDILRSEKDLSEQDVVDKTNEKLLIIRQKAMSYTGRKINELKTILYNLNDEIEDYKSIRGNVKDFFKKLKDDNTLISNEFEVKLNWELGTLPQKWLGDFLEKANEWGTLFDKNEIAEILSGKISLDESLISLFEQISGSSAKYEIKELLDPNSYFKLAFKMLKSNGWDNTGISTGQNYAAVALLCIARLSIIEKPKSGKAEVEGIRFMPIDEAEGLGSNFDMLYKIAKDKDYQIITMSIGILDSFEEGNQAIYILHRNREETKRPENYPPERIFNFLNEKDYGENEVEIPESIE